MIDKTNHTRFEASYAPTGRATCKNKRCGRPIEVGTVRLTRQIPTKAIRNNDTGGISHHYHMPCGCEVAASLRCESKATLRAGSRQVVPTPAPVLSVSPKLSPADAKKVRAEFAIAKASFDTRCFSSSGILLRVK